MAIETIDFDDLPEEEAPKKEPTVNVTFKTSTEARDMLAKIAHRERRNISSMGSIIIEEFITNYVEKYKQSKK